jgi:hypothetical protein
MTVYWAVLSVLLLAALVFRDVIREMCRKETRTRLDQLPQALLWLAVRQLPRQCRDDFGGEWRSELDAIRREASEIPVTGLAREIIFAVGLFIRGRSIARAFEGRPGALTMVRSTLRRLMNNGDPLAKRERTATRSATRDFAPVTMGPFSSRNVLAGLISGIDDFRNAERRPDSRSLGPAMLGAFAWLDDPEFLERRKEFPHACLVLGKQPRDKRQQPRLGTLEPVLKRAPGFPAEALPGLEFLMPLEHRHPPVMGARSPAARRRLPALRTVGYRKTADGQVPVLHAKMVLLGELRWHAKDESVTAEVLRFRPQRLWLGSANATVSSRSNQEVGFWVDDPARLDAAAGCLTELLRHSEQLESDTHPLRPEFVATIARWASAIVRDP